MANYLPAYLLLCISVCFLANAFLSQIGACDEQSSSMINSTLIGLAFAILFWLELQSAGGKWPCASTT